MKKVISFIVPCYNSEEYMERCVNSLLIGGESVEIILVNDGSSDGTAAIINYYVNRFPTIVKGMHQENRGHGGAINTGLNLATGEYVKIVDSDDWVDVGAYQQILDFLHGSIRPDMVISNYVYDKVGKKIKKIMSYRQVLPKEQMFSWEDVYLRVGKYLLMHSVMFRRDVLVECALSLPNHCFYVDNLYVFQPLPCVQTMYYLDCPFYHYYIGREDQSVNEEVMIERIDQQLYVNKRMLSYYTSQSQTPLPIARYMRKYIEIITTVSSILLIKEGTPESIEKKKILWEEIKHQDRQLYRRLRYGLFGIGVHLPGSLGRKTALFIYNLAQRLYGFN